MLLGCSCFPSCEHAAGPAWARLAGVRSAGADQPAVFPPLPPLWWALMAPEGVHALVPGTREMLLYMGKGLCRQG